MERDEEIKQKARELALDWNVGRGNEFYYRFDKLVDIARWADRTQPNPWHKASEELPPICEPCDESADCVLAVLGRQVKIGGKIYLTGFYDHEVKDWYICGNGYSKLTNLEVTDWMLLNKPQS